MAEKTKASKSNFNQQTDELGINQDQHERTMKVQSALYRIADAASGVRDLGEFYAEMHSIVGELMYAENFYIILVDPVKDWIEAAYFVDHAGDPTPTPGPVSLYEKTPTVHVYNTGKPLHASSKDFQNMADEGIIEPFGSYSEDWVGVPLKNEEQILGVLVIQSYEADICYSIEDVEILTFVAQHIADALTRARAIEETRQRNFELQIINSVQEGLASKLDMRAIYDLVGDQIRQIFAAQTVVIYSFDFEERLITYEYIHEKGQRMDRFTRPMTPLNEYVISLGKQPFVVNSGVAEMLEKFEHSIPAGDMPRSVISVPIENQGRISGAISLQDTEHEYAFDESDVSLLVTLANSMSVALENARLFDETQRLLNEMEERNAELAVINSVQEGLASNLDIGSIYELVGNQISEIFPGNTVALSKFDTVNDLTEEMFILERGVRHYPPPYRSGPIDKQRIMAKKTLMFSTVKEFEDIGAITVDGTESSLSGIYAPLIVNDEVVGGLSIESLEEENAFTDSDYQLVTTIANSMSVALENANLFNETQRLLSETEERNAELAVINSVQEGLASKLDMRSIYELVGERVSVIFPDYGVSLISYDATKDMAESMYLLEEGKRHYPPPTKPGNIGRHIIDTKKPLLLSNEADMEKIGATVIEGTADTQSGIYAPLVVNDSVIGAMNVESVTQENAFTESDLRLVTTIANSMSVALENARLFDETQRLLMETEERNSELAVINSVQESLVSKFDIHSVYEMVGERISQIFPGYGVALYAVDQNLEMGEAMFIMERGVRHYPPPFKPGPIGLRAAKLKKPLIMNNRADYEEIGAITVEGTEPSLSGIYAPLLVKDKVIGALNIESSDKEYAFSDSDLQLVTTIANSMSVALENARLFDELQSSNRELTESLEQQTATSEILRVMAGSPTEIKPVLDAVAQNAAKLCEADDVQIYQVDGEFLRQVAHFGPLPALRDGGILPLVPELITGRAVIERKPIHIEDVGAISAEQYPVSAKLQERLGHRTTISTPLIREGVAIGAVVGRRNIVKPFSEKQIDLLSTFADQAAIAIENVRLFNETNRLLNETEERNAELALINAVQQGLVAQMDMDTIYELVGEKLSEIFPMTDVTVGVYDPETDLASAPYLVEKGQRLEIDPIRVNGVGFLGEMVRNPKPILVNENLDQEAEKYGSHLVPGTFWPKSFLSVPLMMSDGFRGVLQLQDMESENSFSELDIRLLETIANSMSVALENARLFDQTQRLLKETEERNAELAVINSVQASLAAKLDMQEIYDAVGDKIHEVFADAQVVDILTYDSSNDLLHPHYVIEKGKRFDIEPWKLRGFRKHIIETGKPLVVNKDMQQKIVEFDNAWVIVGEAPKSWLGVPMIVGSEVKGVITLQHIDKENAFSESDVRLLETLANSMSVSLENARLFDETQRLLKETAQRAAELATINTVSTAMAGELDLEALIQLVGDQIRSTFNADIAYVALLDERTNTINFPYQFGEELKSIEYGQGLTSKIIETGEPLLINQEMDRERKQLGAIRVGKQARSYLGVPIYLAGRAIGVVSVQNTELENVYSENDRRLLSTIAANIGTAIHNASLFDEINRQRQYYQAVIENSPTAIVLHNKDYEITGWNPAAEKLFDYREEEALGQNIIKLVAGNDELYEEAVKFSRGGLRDSKGRLLTQRTRKDGSLVEVDISAVPVEVDGEHLDYIVIYHDITELQRAKQAADQANQAKSTFLANMSHELRTPLNAIIGFTRIVRRKGADILPEKQVENLDKVLVSAEHLLGLINSVLDISKIEAGRMEVHASTFELPPLIDLVVATNQPLVNVDVQITSQVQRDLPDLITDQEKVKQILINLLSNATKFTHEGRISVNTRLDGDLVYIDVQDSGIGISDEALDRIFEEFQQADSGTTRAYGGTGLGLPISQRLARLLGGDITATSQEGVGSTFTLTLPLEYDALAAVKPDTREVVEDMLPSDDPIVLVIDDNKDVHNLLQQNLGEAGYCVVGALSGDEGIMKAHELNPFAITLDIMMPGKDGWQVLHELKTDPHTRHIPVILMTIVDKQSLGMRLGAADYLVKPLDEAAVLASLRRLGKSNNGIHLKRLLVVDSDPSVFQEVQQLLDGTQYEVASASNVEAALLNIKSQLPDVILLDLIMQDEDGFELITELQQDPVLEPIPIIILTSRTLTTDEQDVLDRVVCMVIEKNGLDRKTLVQEVERILSNHALERRMDK